MMGCNLPQWWFSEGTETFLSLKESIANGILNMNKPCWSWGGCVVSKYFFLDPKHEVELFKVWICISSGCGEKNVKTWKSSNRLHNSDISIWNEVAFKWHYTNFLSSVFIPFSFIFLIYCQCYPRRRRCP